MENLFNSTSSFTSDGDLSGVRIADFVTDGRGRPRASPSRFPLVRSGNLVAKSPSRSARSDRARREAGFDPSSGDDHQVCLEWETHRGQYGTGQATSLPHEDGCFWFLVDSQAELVIKVSDAGGDFADMRYSIYSRNLINVAVQMTVQDTVTGEIRAFGDLPGSMVGSDVC
jgi:hypothetical protein